MAVSTARPSAPRRTRRTGRELPRDLRMLWHDVDPVLLAPRLGGALYLVGGLLGCCAASLLVHGADADSLRVVGIATAAFGVLALGAPWQRWSAHMQLAIPVFAFVVFALGGVVAHGSLGASLAVLPLPFVYAGFSQTPGTSLALVPVAALSLLASARFSIDPTLLTTLLIALPMSAVVGEAIAQAQVRRAHAEERVDGLLTAVRVLGRVTDERTGAQLLASLVSDLVGADAVAVMLGERDGARRFLQRAWSGHPALVDAAPLLVDALGNDPVLRGGTTRFVGDTARLRLLSGRGRGVRAAAVVPLPGTGLAPVGLVIAMWGAARRRLNPSARHAAELLSEEAGRMFERLRESAALAHDARTDPLTELANRRTFERALATVLPGDAVVIADLDHFKRVNDRFGHDAGDETLRTLARCLRRTARQVDCVARYGGEEFALVLPEAGTVGALMFLERVRAAWHAQAPATTFSAGVAVHDAGREPRETLRRADAALYEAKDAGRDRDVVAAGAEIVLP